MSSVFIRTADFRDNMTPLLNVTHVTTDMSKSGRHVNSLAEGITGTFKCEKLIINQGADACISLGTLVGAAYALRDANPPEWVTSSVVAGIVDTLDGTGVYLVRAEDCMTAEMLTYLGAELALSYNLDLICFGRTREYAELVLPAHRVIELSPETYIHTLQQPERPSTVPRDLVTNFQGKRVLLVPEWDKIAFPDGVEDALIIAAAGRHNMMIAADRWNGGLKDSVVAIQDILEPVRDEDAKAIQRRSLAIPGGLFSTYGAVSYTGQRGPMLSLYNGFLVTNGSVMELSTSRPVTCGMLKYPSSALLQVSTPVMRSHAYTPLSIVDVITCSCQAVACTCMSPTANADTFKHLGRMDVLVELVSRQQVARVHTADEARERVTAAVSRQFARQGCYNSTLANISKAARVARTLADLDGVDEVTSEHILKAERLAKCVA